MFESIKNFFGGNSKTNNPYHTARLERLEDRTMLDAVGVGEFTPAVVDLSVLHTPDNQSAYVGTQQVEQLKVDAPIDLSSLLGDVSSVEPTKQEPVDYTARSLDNAFADYNSEYEPDWVDRATECYGSLTDIPEAQPTKDVTYNCDGTIDSVSLTFYGADGTSYPLSFSADRATDYNGDAYNTKDYFNQQRLDDNGIRGNIKTIDDVQAAVFLNDDNLLTAVVNVSYTREFPGGSGDITFVPFTTDYSSYFCTETEEIDTSCDTSVDGEEIEDSYDCNTNVDGEVVDPDDCNFVIDVDEDDCEYDYNPDEDCDCNVSVDGEEIENEYGCDTSVDGEVVDPEDYNGCVESEVEDGYYDCVDSEVVTPIYNDSVTYEGDVRCADEIDFNTFLYDEQYSWISSELAERFPGDNVEYGQFFQVDIDDHKFVFFPYTRDVDGEPIQTLFVADIGEQYKSIQTVAEWANNVNIDNVNEICTFNDNDECPVKVYTSDVYEYDGKQYKKESIIIDFQGTLQGCDSYYPGQAGKCFEHEVPVTPPDEPYRPDVPSHDFHVHITNNQWSANQTYFSYHNEQPYNPGPYTTLYGGGGFNECCSEIDKVIKELAKEDCCDEIDSAVNVLCDEHGSVIEEHCGECEIVNNAVDEVFNGFTDYEEDIADECCEAINSAIESQTKTEEQAMIDAVFEGLANCKEEFGFDAGYPAVIGGAVLRTGVPVLSTDDAEPTPQKKEPVEPAIPEELLQESPSKESTKADKASVGAAVVAAAAGAGVFKREQKKTSFFGRIRNSFKNAARRLGDFFYELGA